jgi:hypothetical protein
MASALLLVGVPAYASTPPLPPPVADVPDIPSRVSGTMPTNSPLANKTLWALRSAAMMNLAGAGAEVATTAPKIITPAATLSRGAAGGPLVGAFLGGFAIGQGGLLLYGAVTGDDPLDEVCGTGFLEDVAGILYLGMMPDCKALIPVPNEDQPAGFAPLTYGGYTISFGHNLSNGTSCWDTEGTFTGYSMEIGGGGVWNSVPGYNGWSGCAPVDTWYGYQGIIRIIPTQGAEPLVMQALDSNPSRTPRCTVSGDGGSVTRSGTPYTETEGLPLSSQGLGCAQAYEDFVSEPGRGPGFLPDRIQVESEADGGAITEIADQTVPEYTPDQEKALNPITSRGLVLEKIVGTLVRSCMTWDADCANWWATTNNGTQPSTGTTTYRCTFGGQQIALVECGIYRQTFDTPTSTPTVTDPDTGLQTPWLPGQQPSTNPGTGTGTFPSTGANPTPGVSTATGGGGCTAGWSWNPGDWVLNPIRCAFIPSEASVTAAQATMASKWTTTSVGSLATAVAGWSFVAPASSGCDGIAVPLSVLGNGIEDFHILNACAGEPLEPLALLSTMVIGIGCVLTAIRAVTGNIGGIVGQRALAGGD